MIHTKSMEVNSMRGKQSLSYRRIYYEIIRINLWLLMTTLIFIVSFYINMPSIRYLIFPLILSTLMFPLWRYISIKSKFALDDPKNKTKNHLIHKNPIPTSAGIVMTFVFWVTIYALYHFKILELARWEIFNVFVISSILALIGFIDDLYHIRARYKLFLELLLGGWMFLLLKAQSVDFGLFDLNLNFITLSVFILFFAGAINSINFIDGMDGLAGGISILIFGLVAFISWKIGNLGSLILSLILITVLLVFLIFNFHPAQIFMGDSGSMFIGGMIAYLSFYTGTEAGTFHLYPFLIVLFIPILDVSWAIIRRLKSRKNIFYPDKHHLHHKLLRKGLSIRQTVLLLWSGTAILAIIAILTFQSPPIIKFLVYMILFIAWIGAGKVLHWI